MPNAKPDAQDRRILAVVGENEAPREELLKRWNDYLNSELTFPILVTGSEDFRWEEPYIVGRRGKEEYERLRKEQPSYRDMYELTAIDEVADYEWCLFQEDLKAHIRRKSDGGYFVLGLCELEAVDKQTRAYELLDDYSVWFVNSR